jgi:hypothetical protein
VLGLCASGRGSAAAADVGCSRGRRAIEYVDGYGSCATSGDGSTR